MTSHTLSSKRASFGLVMSYPSMSGVSAMSWSARSLSVSLLWALTPSASTNTMATAASTQPAPLVDPLMVDTSFLATLDGPVANLLYLIYIQVFLLIVLSFTFRLFLLDPLILSAALLCTFCPASKKCAVIHRPKNINSKAVHAVNVQSKLSQQS